MKRVIEKEIVNELAKDLLAGKFIAEDTIYVGTDAKGFTFTSTKTESTEKPKVEPKLNNTKKSDVDKLNKATKDLNDLIKDVNPDEN